ncbi:aminotransferase-like domain-containing protein [Staphylococcus caeli]|uniref:HTH-type transcriptional regulator NorG n=1 Tax=Staphylococcus caeli TaxID=2201815 RepID=A0A1D4NRI9_9STAP|nr:putative GntR family transcriptional regulator [Staphylococcus caeli]SCT09680.1 bacterial regulatory s, gntR family protein [Staphylococcus caeli]SCT13304.1 bacterial regulatory s, gntR family protein [Staphylococcus caeli]
MIDGNWFYGMRIPSHRKLANQFNVNRVTIIKSIELLESEGFIYTKKGSGTYINDYLNADYILNKWSEMMDWSFRIRNQYTVQLINKIETDSTYIHISKGELGKDLIPHLELKNAMTNVSNYIGDLSFGYNNGYGYTKLRELIAERLKVDGINITKDNVLITSGALHAIQLLVTGFLSQNTIIFSNTPSYIDSTHVFDYLNMKKVKISYNKLSDFQKIINKQPSNKEKALYVEPSFNNPTGQSISEKIREDMVNYSRVHNMPIIEDDIYIDIWFDEKPARSIKSLDTNNNVIHISSFSKSIAPAIRIGWAIASEKVIEQLADIRMQIDYGSSILSQMVVYELLKNGDYDRHVTKLRNVLKEKRDYMLNILNANFSEIAQWEIPEGGFFIWVNFNENINVKKLFSELIDKEKILINPGFIYGSEKNTIRLSYAFESRENIKYALEKIYQYAMYKM